MVRESYPLPSRKVLADDEDEREPPANRRSTHVIQFAPPLPEQAEVLEDDRIKSQYLRSHLGDHRFTPDGGIGYTVD